jgi:hypothetical protein
MFGIHRTTAALFGRRTARDPANNRPAHHRTRRAWRIEQLEGRTLLSTYQVLYGSGSGANTLPWAIDHANKPGDDTIDIQVKGTITLKSALADLSDTNHLTEIKGLGASVLTVARSGDSGTPEFRIFTIDAGVKATLDGLTISRGYVEDVGGGIYNSGTLTVSHCTLENNTAYGGGIDNVGMLTVSDSIIRDNHLSAPWSTEGGGIRNDKGGDAEVVSCTIVGNAANYGGGIMNRGTLTVETSTINGNIAYYSGGAINADGATTIISCTIEGNTAEGYEGGGIQNFRDTGGTAGPLSIVSSTIAGNSAGNNGGGIMTREPIALTNTIVAGNFASGIAWDTDGIGEVVQPSSTNNLIGVDTGLSGISNGTNGNLVGTAANPIDPRLGPLQDNGGPTMTMALLPGSPARDAGNNSLIPPNVQYDQRGPGFQRIVNATGKAIAIVDIGAFEWQPYVSSFAAYWGNRTAPLKLAADGLHVLPAGRKTDLPWPGIKQLAISLSTAETLTPNDVTVSSTSGTDYGPVTLSGSGTSYTIKLHQLISQADRVTIQLNLGGLVTPAFELDVLPGDVNDDGIVNAQDMVLIRNAIKETGDPLMIGWADIDGDGSVGLADYLAARKKLGSRLP